MRGARFIVMLCSVLGTLASKGSTLSVGRRHGSRGARRTMAGPPGDLFAWLPWSMSAERRRAQPKKDIWFRPFRKQETNLNS